MKKTSPAAASAVLLGLLAAAGLSVSPVRAQLPAKAAPSGMRQVTTGGAGRILSARVSGTSSARKALVALKRLTGKYFDQPITITRAYADPADKHVQAAFTARLGGVPVHGVAATAVAGEGVVGTLLFDNARTFGQSFHALAARSGVSAGSGGGKAASPVHLTRQTAPDGSCQISLPDGFHITGSYKGTLDIVGTQGAQMSLGGVIICTTREAAAFFPGLPPVSFNDPVQAIVDYVRYSAAKAGKSARVQVLDSRPVPDWQTGKAAYVRYSAQIDGKTFQGFGLFSIAQTDVNQAILYSSFIAAPDATYRQQFPGMMQAWGTWSINPSVFTERLVAAAQSMRGMNDIILSGNANTQRVNDQVNEAWSDVMRDQGTWENPGTGDRYKLPNTFTNLGAPTQEGVPLQAVPLGDL